MAVGSPLWEGHELNFRSFRYLVNVSAIAGGIGYLAYKMVYPSFEPGHQKSAIETPSDEINIQDQIQTGQIQQGQIQQGRVHLEKHLQDFGQLEIDLSAADKVYVADNIYTHDLFYIHNLHRARAAPQLTLDNVM